MKIKFNCENHSFKTQPYSILHILSFVELAVKSTNIKKKNTNYIMAMHKPIFKHRDSVYKHRLIC